MFADSRSTTTCSSFDGLKLTSMSPWPSSKTSRVRVIRLIRPHLRRIPVATASDSNYGFSVRGGKEYGTGFFVSNVDRLSESDLKGLRIGDQILRINGFRVVDATHKEFTQFVSKQDRLTIKVRCVGMLPFKEKDDDPIFWHVLQTKSTKNITTSDSAKNTAVICENRNEDIKIILTVAPRSKLGLGICKGPDWKPGIFVQFTKEKSVARDAGLRPGDQILRVNNIDFSDVLFSEAVAVMKGSNELEMIVRTSAGCDLFPGESSGYNSSASSITGDQSPCWTDSNSKRLTAVREESISKIWKENENIDLDQRSSKLHVNKTIIKLSDNLTSINNTMELISSSECLPEEKDYQRITNTNTLTRVTVPGKTVEFSQPPTPPANKCFLEKEICTSEYISNDISDECNYFDSLQCETQSQNQTNTISNYFTQSKNAKGTLNEQRFLKPPSLKCDSEQKTLYAPIESRHTNNNHVVNRSDTSSSSLCTAITQELQKRKEKQQNNYAETSSLCNASNDQSKSRIPRQYQKLEKVTATGKPGAFHQQSLDKSGFNEVKETHSSAVTHLSKKPQEQLQCKQHNALMDEFRRVHQRMFRNGFQENEAHMNSDITMHLQSVDEAGMHSTGHLKNHNMKSPSMNEVEVSKLNYEDIKAPQLQSRFATNTDPIQSLNKGGLAGNSTVRLPKTFEADYEDLQVMNKTRFSNITENKYENNDSKSGSQTIHSVKAVSDGIYMSSTAGRKPCKKIPTLNSLVSQNYKRSAITNSRNENDQVNDNIIRVENRFQNINRNNGNNLNNNNGTGILKVSNSHHRYGSYPKNPEKTISFGD